MEFTELNFQPSIEKGIEKAGFKTCTTVQELALPVGLSGKDLIVRSKTGSGKTAVFVLTFLERFLEAKKLGNMAKAIVISPTRELALQIAEDAKVLASGIPDFKIGCFYGGVGYEKQEQEAHDGLDLFVGTPGRLLDFKRSGKIKFNLFTDVIIDEADRVFDMGFLPDIKAIFAGLVDKTKRQTMLFSATMSVAVQNLAWSYMNEPQVINACPEEITVKQIEQELYHVSKSIKFSVLLSLLDKEKPKSALIFTNMKYRSVEVCERLKANGYNSAYLMGDMPQSKRLTTLQRMKDGKIDILVATDVAARGLQIDDLELVVNYDIPEDFENYVHRIGRTARAGKSGKAITLACEEYVYGLEDIEKYIQMKIPVFHYEDLAVVEDRSGSRSYGQKPKGPSANRQRKPGSGYDRKPGSDYKPKAKTGDKAYNKPYSGDKANNKPYAKDKAYSKPYSGDKAYTKDKAYNKPYSYDKTDNKAYSKGKNDDEAAKLSKMDSASRMQYYKKRYAAAGLEEKKALPKQSPAPEPVKKLNFFQKLFKFRKKK